jgi:hypothetical protein
VVYKGITDPASLESMTCREALALAEDLALTRLIVASDCKGVVIDIAEGTKERYASIIDEIKSRTRQFQNCTFVHEFRACKFFLTDKAQRAKKLH